MSEGLLKNTFLPEKLKTPFLQHHIHPQICSLGTSHLLSLIRFKGVSHENRDLNIPNQGVSAAESLLAGAWQVCHGLNPQISGFR